MKRLKKIIREEIGGFDWVSKVPKSPIKFSYYIDVRRLTVTDKKDLIDDILDVGYRSDGSIMNGDLFNIDYILLQYVGGDIEFKVLNSNHNYDFETETNNHSELTLEDFNELFYVFKSDILKGALNESLDWLSKGRVKDVIPGEYFEESDISFEYDLSKYINLVGGDVYYNVDIHKLDSLFHLESRYFSMGLDGVNQPEPYDSMEYIPQDNLLGYIEGDNVSRLFSILRKVSLGGLDETSVYENTRVILEFINILMGKSGSIYDNDDIYDFINESAYAEDYAYLKNSSDDFIRTFRNHKWPKSVVGFDYIDGTYQIKLKFGAFDYGTDVVNLSEMFSGFVDYYFSTNLDTIPTDRIDSSGCEDAINKNLSELLDKLGDISQLDKKPNFEDMRNKILSIYVYNNGEFNHDLHLS